MLRPSETPIEVNRYERETVRRTRAHLLQLYHVARSEIARPSTRGAVATALRAALDDLTRVEDALIEEDRALRGHTTAV